MRNPQDILNETETFLAKIAEACPELATEAKKYENEIGVLAIRTRQLDGNLDIAIGLSEGHKNICLQLTPISDELRNEIIENAPDFNSFMRLHTVYMKLWNLIEYHKNGQQY